MSEQILAHLRYCLVKDIERDGSGGFRSTRDVAEAIDLTMVAARRLLWKLADENLIEACDGGASGESGNPILWRALPTPPEGDAK